MYGLNHRSFLMVLEFGHPRSSHLHVSCQVTTCFPVHGWHLLVGPSLNGERAPTPSSSHEDNNPIMVWRGEVTTFMAACGPKDLPEAPPADAVPMGVKASLHGFLGDLDIP